MDLIKAREKVDSLLSDLRVAQRRCKDERAKLVEAEDRLTYVEEAQKIAQQVAEQVQQRVHNQIAGVVSRCLEAVFYEDNYGFKIQFVKKRGRTEAVLILTKDGHEIVDPLNYDSGAVCEIAALPLRLSCLIMSKPRLRKLLILDEPFKALSVHYYDRVRLLLNSLSEDFGIQIVMVTHNPKLQTGEIVEL
jgi:DNA repair exonuclease SbcCD ATPase subunit